ncbi:hypothetical protein scyTo_0001128 [Scyliorhinus torazame]|uniref:Alpha-2,8-sialyltransferase 8B-like n=1 Tax=Scyliorhinus torazame TaxID=75743 RepID=A0A401P9N0_SCYTO|nr:hypothetical protein [Scyliorhinus torazame]
MFGLLTVLAILLILADISQVEMEFGFSEGRRAMKSAKDALQNKCCREEMITNTSSAVPRERIERKESIQRQARLLEIPEWKLNTTLTARIRKDILKFLDAEKDISVLKGRLKAGDIIHYIFDRDRTLNISHSLYELLPRTSPMKNKHFKQCAIVGNSGILLNSGCGQEIDTHEFVIRYWLTNRVLIKRPTTGLLMYTLATRFCDEIHLYGFWPFPKDQKGNAVKYHYYDSLTYEYNSRATPHTMPLEFKTLRNMHLQGALKLNVGECKLTTQS